MISRVAFLPQLVCASVSRPISWSGEIGLQTNFMVWREKNKSFAGVKTIAVGLKNRTGPGLVF